MVIFFLLDTNIIIDIFVGNQEIDNQIKSIKRPVVSAITIGELYYGAEKSQQKSKHLKQIEDFVQICQVLAVDVDTSTIYGKIKNELKKKGKPIPENDLWIAASCIQHNLVLITDDNHFLEIENIKLRKNK
jgi:tRNA(fMet)-specific endonuclease VapC